MESEKGKRKLENVHSLMDKLRHTANDLSFEAVEASHAVSDFENGVVSAQVAYEKLAGVHATLEKVASTAASVDKMALQVRDSGSDSVSRTGNEEMDAVSAKIEAAAREQGFEVLFSSVCGSRVYGLNDEKSDYDTHFVFVYPKERYLSLQQPPDFISLEDDITGFELGKFLRMIGKSAYGALEMLTSPLVLTGTLTDEVSRKDFLDFALRFFNPHTLVRSFAGHMRIEKKRLDNKTDLRGRVKAVLSASRLLMMGEYIAHCNMFPTLDYKELLSDCSVFMSYDVVRDFERLAHAKTSGDYSRIDNDKLDGMLEKLIALGDEMFNRVPKEPYKVEGTFDELDAFFKKHVF